MTRQPGSRALSMLWRIFRRIRFSVSGRFKTASSRKVSYQRVFSLKKQKSGGVSEGTCCARRTGRPSERDTKRVRRRQYRMQRQRQRGGLWKDRKARQGRRRPCARTVPKAGKRRQCRLILAKIPCGETVVDPGGENAE